MSPADRSLTSVMCCCERGNLEGFGGAGGRGKIMESFPEDALSWTLQEQWMVTRPEAGASQKALGTLLKSQDLALFGLGTGRKGFRGKVSASSFLKDCPVLGHNRGQVGGN